MLTNINPLLTPELLYVLALMGHGDEITVVDANFPADSVARRTGHGSVVTLAGASATEAVQAILSVLPLDDFVDEPVRTMAAPPPAAIGPGPSAPGGLAPVQEEVQRLVDASAGRHWPLGRVERFAFYEAAAGSYAVVLTSERRLYGNFLLKKGVVPPQAQEGATPGAAGQR
ncbi:MAG TPA: RbsD/FucU domain-containing protein [Acidimicrobiales bacterium]|nr:RbsD/FucU domain-containing protein [Acidimicrobiales bacterium]